MSDQHPAHDQHDHGSLKSYTTGLILSIILTIIPFGVVMTGVMPQTAALAVIVIAAVVQIVVQVVYFLHLKEPEGSYWNNLSIWFTLIVVGILVVGSVWIMYHLNHNTMAGM